jgi:hypothetical protein
MSDVTVIARTLRRPQASPNEWARQRMDTALRLSSVRRHKMQFSWKGVNCSGQPHRAKIPEGLWQVSSGASCRQSLRLSGPAFPRLPKSRGSSSQQKRKKPRARR